MGTEASRPGSGEQDHHHRWRIEEQGAARSVGICRCGAERVFSNVWEEAAYVSRAPGRKSPLRAQH